MTVATAVVSAFFSILFAVLLIFLVNVLMKSLEMYRVWAFFAWVCGVKYKGPPVRQQVRHGAALAEDLLYPASHRLWVYTVRDEMRRQDRLSSQVMDFAVEDTENLHLFNSQCEVFLIAKTAVRFDNQEVESLKFINIEGADRMESFVRNGNRLFGTSKIYCGGYTAAQKVGDVYIYDLGDEVTEDVAEKASKSGMRVWAAEDVASVQKAITSGDKT